MSLESNNAEYLKNLSGDSTIIYFLRVLYGLMVDYGVYLPSENYATFPVIISKSQLAFLIERGFADSLVKTLPELAARKMVQTLSIEDFESPEDVRTLFIESTGTFLTSMARALDPDEPQIPEWWDAPVPFAICSRGVLRLNPTAIQKFGQGLERLNAKNLPSKRDEFIVRVDGRERSRLFAFKKLRPSIYSLEDCTEDLTEAQDITWWASVGKACAHEIENRGGKWKRSKTQPEILPGNSNRKVLACEWNGQSQGYLVIDDIIAENPKPNPEIIANPVNNNNSDSAEEHVINNIGPQAMALLAAGQTQNYRENNYGNFSDKYEVMI